MGYSVREVAESELPAVVSVINAAFQVENFFKCADRTSLEDVQQQIANGGRFLVALDEAGVVCASILVEHSGPRAYFGMLAVKPGLQRSGLGRTMVTAAEDWGRAQGCSYMEMCIIDLRADLPDYYHSLGYVDSRVDEVHGCPAEHFTKPVKFRYMSKSLVDEGVGLQRQ